MTLYKFQGFYTTVYTGVADPDGGTLAAVPGQTYELDAAPDHLWTTVSSSKKAPEAPVEPSTPKPEVTPTPTESDPQ